MRKLLMKRLKNQKGLTLIELLAVIVILGIIAAIAVPSIGNIIDNTKKDAHLANAQQMVSSARLLVIGENILPSTGTIYLPLAYLLEKGYIESMKDPDGSLYETITNNILPKTVLTDAGNSYVTVNRAVAGGPIVYSVRLTNGQRGVQITTVGPPNTYVAVQESGLQNRANVQNN